MIEEDGEKFTSLKEYPPFFFLGSNKMKLNHFAGGVRETILMHAGGSFLPGHSNCFHLLSSFSNDSVVDVFKYIESNLSST